MELRQAAAGLYVHVPFCARICPYCDFAVLTARPERHRAFVALVADEATLAAGWREPIDTIYLGGGTPSLLEPSLLERLVADLKARLPIAADAWITLEANPEDVSDARLAAWRELGVGGLSLGVQALDAASLRLLGRRHTPAQAVAAVARALEAGFTWVSIDLIYALPGQAAGAWRATLESAVALAPHHLSCYTLTFHERTPFERWRGAGRLVELDEAAQAELVLLTHASLDDAGYAAYEVSSFARTPADRSRHNAKYWNHTPYLGLGPSAHSFDGTRRWWNVRRLRDWEARLQRGERPRAGGEELGPAELALEAVMLALRTPAGIDRDGFAARFGWELVARNQAWVDSLSRAGLVRCDERRLSPTRKGLAVADFVARGFEVTPS